MPAFSRSHLRRLIAAVRSAATTADKGRTLEDLQIIVKELKLLLQ
jgi:hypothetical protein